MLELDDPDALDWYVESSDCGVFSPKPDDTNPFNYNIHDFEDNGSFVVIDRYHPEKVLGKGAYGVVW